MGDIYSTGYTHHSAKERQFNAKLNIGCREKCNKKKKQLPPLSPSTPEDPQLFYKSTYNINLFDYKIRRRFNVSSILQYNYGYTRTLQLHQAHTSQPTIIVEDLTEKANTNAFYVISDKDQSIINDPSVFL